MKNFHFLTTRGVVLVILTLTCVSTFETSPVEAALIEASILRRNAKIGEYKSVLKRVEEVYSECGSAGEFQMGTLHELGELDLDVNFTEALSWYSRAAGKGNRYAQQALGRLLSSLPTPIRNSSISILYHSFAHGAGEVLKDTEPDYSDIAMGYRHLYGIGVDRDCAKAANYYERAAWSILKALKEEKEVYSIGGISGHISPGIRSVVVNSDPEEVISLHISAHENHPYLHEELDDAVWNYISGRTFGSLHLMKQETESSGDTQKLNYLAQCYYYGINGIEQSYENAISTYITSFRLSYNDPIASIMIGEMLEQGLGVEKNSTLARQYYEHAANNLNYAPATTLLGLLYLNGEGVEKNSHKALTLIEQAAKHGDPNAMAIMGDLYITGLSVKNMKGEDAVVLKADITKALAYHKLGARYKHPNSMYKLGKMMTKGLGIKRACFNGANYFRSVVEKYVVSIYAVESLRYFHLGDIPRAYAYSVIAADLGMAAAQANVAYLLENHGQMLGRSLSGLDTIETTDSSPMYPQVKNALEIAKLSDSGIDLYLKAAEQSDVIAQLFVGDNYYIGRGVDKSFERALEWYYKAAGISTGEQIRLSSVGQGVSFNKKATEAAAAQAYYNLGYMYQYGLGTKRDFYLAKRYFELAASLDANATLIATLSVLFLYLEHIYTYHLSPILRMVLDNTQLVSFIVAISFALGFSAIRYIQGLNRRVN